VLAMSLSEALHQILRILRSRYCRKTDQYVKSLLLWLPFVCISGN
jgi:hypothetical protein